MKTRDDCIFCKIVSGSVPSTRIFEDDRAVAIMDISPLNKGHLLVLPKEHFENIFEIDPNLYGHLMSIICRIAKSVEAAVNPEGMNVLQLNGKAGNQVVPHLHIHIVPRWSGDGLTITAWEPIMGDMAGIAATGEAIKSKLTG